MTIVHVLNTNLNRVGDIKDYISLIWAERYVQHGDCELYLPLKERYLTLIKQNYYLIIDDSETICVIKKIEIITDSEKGNHIIVTGYNCTGFTDQRIIWTRTACSHSKGEAFIRYLVMANMIEPTSGARRFAKTNGENLIALAELTGLNQKLSANLRYENLGGYIRDVLNDNGWGQRMIFDSENQIMKYGIYKGRNQSAKIIFKPDFRNLASSNYIEDTTNLKNVVKVYNDENYRGHSFHGARIAKIGRQTDSFHRFEIAQESKSIRTMSYDEMVEAFPGGTTEEQSGSEDTYAYVVSPFEFVIPNGDFEDYLATNYPQTTQFSTVDGQRICIMSSCRISVFEGDPDNNPSCSLSDIPFQLMLTSAGLEELGKYGKEIKFNGQITPESPYVYGEDYFLGDIVTVENGCGVTATVRIVEAIRTWDENGTHLELSYELQKITEEED